MNGALVHSHLPSLPPPVRGKVRDVYDLGSRLLLVATDRISAYDHILAPGIPGKGRVLHQLSSFWFEELVEVLPHHLVATQVADFPADLRTLLGAAGRRQLEGRAALVKKARVVPFECVARGYLAGSGFREYQAGGQVCGVPLPAGLVRASRLPAPIFTPATKAAEGHDENVSFATMAERLPAGLAERLRDLTLALYARGAERAARGGLILADTKFELGFEIDPVTGQEGPLLLVDEALTPDSSRYWEAASWTPGHEPISFDKQFVRNWLDASGWDHESPPPELPHEVVAGTLERYVEAFRRITGREPDLAD
ncbi:MAG: phosphoribosylaminoimidazolesuccinocarboxamide synthase [Thermoanaerobaculia bacterium]|nr:phosphoribosylaminoimidazolesuccinocarboxamide synthase [Thermoanaerobaculia bacterium]